MSPECELEEDYRGHNGTIQSASAKLLSEFLGEVRRRSPRPGTRGRKRVRYSLIGTMIFALGMVG
jgi:hypothetical protein